MRCSTAEWASIEAIRPSGMTWRESARNSHRIYWSVPDPRRDADPARRAAIADRALTYMASKLERRLSAHRVDVVFIGVVNQ